MFAGLKPVLSFAGDLVIFKERGTVAIVFLEKIIIEASSLTFVLRPVPGQSAGLQDHKEFAVSATFPFLSTYRHQWSCSIAGWIIETNPLKVANIRHLFKNGASNAEIVAGFNSTPDNADSKSKKVIFSLARLNGRLRTGQLSFRKEPNFKGQSWSGAGVMVLTQDEETIKQYAHFEGLKVVSSEAEQIGDLFRKIGRITIPRIL